MKEKKLTYKIKTAYSEIFCHALKYRYNKILCFPNTG